MVSISGVCRGNHFRNRNLADLDVSVFLEHVVTGESDFLFEKMFFQAAHIAILEEALATARKDLVELSDRVDITPALMKIDVAYDSIEKLKKGISNG